MSGFNGSIFIMGAGPSGNTILSSLLKDKNIEILGVMDKNPDAPGLLTARKHGIPVFSDSGALPAPTPAIIIDADGDGVFADEIQALKAPGTEVIDGKSAMLLLHLIERRVLAREEMKNLLHETRELYRIGISITSADTIEEGLDTLLVEALRTVNAPAGSIALYNEREDTLVLKALHGFSPAFSHVLQWKKRSGGMTDHILSKRVPTVIEDTESCSYIDNVILLKEGTRSIIAVPLFANDRVIGILYIDDFKPRQWKQQDVEFLTLLGIQAAFAIEKFRLIEEISNTKTYLQNVLDNSADIVMTTDTEGRIVEFNKGATRLLGYKKEDFVGRKAEELWVRPDERHDILKTLEREGYVSNYETQLKTMDGRVSDISLTLSSLRSDEGKFLGTVGVSKDITEKKRLERAVEERNLELQELNDKLEEKVFERTKDLEKANRELERSNKLKSQFIATMSHELRTPLNSILGFSELLLDDFHGELSEKQKRHVQNIYNSGSHLLQLINNILDLAKIESGKMELHLESFAVKQPLAEVQMVIKSLADKKKQILTIKVDDAVPLIKADRIKFKQILYNLLSNAVKFTPEGGIIVLDAELITGPALPVFARHLDIFSDRAAFLKLSIIDSGIGIKSEDRERIFAEFEQGDSSYSRKYEGTGLGLALTKRLVQLHGGEIAVESEEGRGSTFTVIIPLFGLEAAVATVPPPHTPVIKQAPTYNGVVKNKRENGPLILVVEDDPATSEVLTLYLAQGGYRVAHAFDGLEAVNRMRELKPFAVLLDIMLPGKDGWEILQEVKSDPELKDIPIIVSSIVDNRELGFALGASDYLVKPVDRMAVLSKIENLSLPSKRKGKNINILCIDDHVDVLELLTGILEPAGYNVLTANSGRSGIEQSIAYNPDLVILDLMMPDVDGFEVVQVLKSSPATENIPVLILTAKDLTVDDRLRLAGKIESFVQKSHFTKEDLLMTIKDLEMTYPARAGLLDEVSGLFDSSYFQLRMAQEVSRAGRCKTTFTTVVIDLDNFTEYIKAHGISRANICIRKVADILRKGLRGSDVVVRCGIDEFAVVLSGTPKESAEAVAGRFLAYIDSYPFFGEEVMPTGKVTASIAVVNYPQDALSPEEIIFKSHRMLREIKKNGGRKVQLYEE